MPPKSVTYRSLQELLLGKWDDYRVLLEDPLSYNIHPPTFLESSPQLHKIIDQAMMTIDTMNACGEVLNELLSMFRVLLDLFAATLLDDPLATPTSSVLSVSSHLPASWTPPQMPSPSLLSVTRLTPFTLSPELGFSNLPASALPSNDLLLLIGPPQLTPSEGKDALFNESGTLVVSQSLLTNITTTSSQGQGSVLTERMQHDLIALMISVLSGLMHHLDIILAQPATNDTELELYRAYFIGRISDVVSIVWFFFGKIAANKKRFSIMMNHLINCEVLFAAVHCIANVMTQSITSYSLAFMLDLVRNDHTTALLLIQSYDVLSLLHIRFQLLVDIDRLGFLHKEYTDPATGTLSLPHTAELALQVKPPHEALQPKHIEPFYDLLQLYQQFLRAIMETYTRGFVDDEFILELQSQVMFIIRYLQLFANQVHKIATLQEQLQYDLQLQQQQQQQQQLQQQSAQPPNSNSTLNTTFTNPSPAQQQSHRQTTLLLPLVPETGSSKPQTNLVDLSVPPGLTLDLVRTLFVSNSSTINPPNNGAAQHSGNLLGSSASNWANASRRASLAYQESLAASGGSATMSNGDAIAIDVGGSPNGPGGSRQGLNFNPPITTDTMAMFRPLLQLSVDILQLISDMLAKHPNLIDVFLYRDIGIIPTCVKLVVIYRLERSITSYSPSVGTK